MKFPFRNQRSAEPPPLALSLSFGSGAPAELRQNIQIATPMPVEPRRTGVGRRNFAMAQTDRLLGGWATSLASRNDMIRSSLRKMRSRARQLAHDDEHAINYLELCRNNIVGADGILTKVLSRDESGSLDERANAMILDAWIEWGKRKNCMVSEEHSWWEVQRLVATEEPQAGEVFLRMVEGFDNPFGFALQWIEADCVDEEHNKKLGNGNRIRMGIEKDVWGRKVNYWIRTENPYDSFSEQTKLEPIAASEMLHKFLPLGPKDVRGIPWLHASGRSMHMLNEYDFSAMVAARAGADQRGFLEHVADANGEYAGEGPDEKGNTISSVEPGTIEELPPGLKFSQVESDYPHAQYGAFVKARLRTISAGLRGANYNQLTGDYESVNYSSLRAAFLDSRDVWKSLQMHFVLSVGLPVFEKWLLNALLKGAIKLPAEKFNKFHKPKFIGRGWAWVDPQAEVAAAKESVACGFTSQSQVIASNGGDRDTVFAEQENDRTSAFAYGLSFEGDKLLQRANTIGILGRAGVITPNRDDEAKVRADFNLPAPSKEVQTAWDKSEGVRLPITLQTPENFEIGNNGAASTTNPPAKKKSD